MTFFHNIAGYKFITLLDLLELRSNLKAQALACQLKGTILLSPEGINLTLAGHTEGMASFIEYLRKDARFEDIIFRDSYSSFQPFNYMKVKIKKEIITLRQPDIRPELQSAPTISPQEFKQWLDEKRNITVLDTRNDYEIDFGTFHNAINLHLEDFGEFPKAAKTIPNDKPIVMFCTGGIRCEKAALVMLQAGYSNIYQLQGGILNYFADVGGDYYQGKCFVFDQRVALDANLQPIDHA